MFSIATTLLLGATALGAPTTDSQAEEPATSVTIYSSADPAGFDPQRFIGQQRNGGDFNFASQVPGFGGVRQTRSVALR
ncbi:MAG TPA: hypothetical protein DCG14_00005, partial [Phycisphaerales bacterium]|nr:hypothetical protein [Phycisphaerales bacterium]